MTRNVPATYWALIGKEPDTKDDYSMLSEGPRRADGHEDRAWAGIPSTPELGGAPGPGRLPWATFTPYTAAGQCWMAVTIVEATRHLDAIGRPVVRARYLELPFAEFASGATSYTALQRAVPEADVMKSAGPATPPLLDLGASSDGTQAAVGRALADRATFDHAARIAARVLAGDVLIAVHDADLPSLGERLALVDRVLALLPFGVRAGVTIASWQDGTGRAAFRLAYGRFAHHGQPVVGHSGQVSPPSDGIAGEYLYLLSELCELHGAARIVDHLAAHWWPLAPTGANAAAGTPDNNLEALEILRCLSDPHLAVAAARSGTGSADRLAVAWLSGDERLDQRARDDLETRLLQMGGGSAAAAVLPRWSRRTAKLAAAVVLDELAAGDQAVQYAGGEQGATSVLRSSPAAWRLRAYAAQCDADDSYLTALIDGWLRRGADGIPAGPVAACLDGTPPRDGDLRGFRLALLGAPSLARVLLRLSLRRDPAARPDLVGELRTAARSGLLGSPASAAPGDQLAALDSVGVAQLIADQLDALDPAAAAWIDWLDPAEADAPAWLARYAVLIVPAPTPVPLPRTPSAPDIVGAKEDLPLIAWLAVRRSDFSALSPEWWPELYRLARARAGTHAGSSVIARVHDRLRADLDGQSPHWWPQLRTGGTEVAAGADNPDDIRAVARAQADLRRLAALAGTLRLGGADPLADACADTLRLYLGLPPAHHPVNAGQKAAGSYLDALWAVWSEPPADADSTALTLLLLTAVFRSADSFGSPGRDPVDAAVSPAPVIRADPLGAFAVTLLRDVVLDDRSPLNAVIADEVADIVSAHPALLRNARLTSDWWARVEQLCPDIRDPARRLRIAVREAATTAGQDSVPDREVMAGVAVLSGLAIAEGGLTAEELAAIIRPLLDLQPPRNREAVLRVITGTLRLVDDQDGARVAEQDRARAEATLSYLLGVQAEQGGARLRRRRP